MEDVLGRDGLLADAAFGEGDVLGNARAQVVADHQHVEMLGHGVDRVGPRRVGRRRQHVRQARHLDDVGRMAAAGALGVEGVDGAALEGGDGVLDEAGLVQRVGVDRHLHVMLVGDGQAVVDGGGRGAPILVQLQAAGAGRGSAPPAPAGSDALPLPMKPRFIGKASAASIIRSQMPGAGVQVVASVPCAGPVPPPSMVVMPEYSASSICCGAMKWIWLSMPPAVRILPSPAMISVPGPMMMVTPGCVSGLPALPMAAMRPSLQADIGLDDAPVVEDQRVGDDGVHGAAGARDLRLAHAVADHLAAAELHLLAVER